MYCGKCEHYRIGGWCNRYGKDVGYLWEDKCGDALILESQIRSGEVICGQLNIGDYLGCSPYEARKRASRGDFPSVKVKLYADGRMARSWSLCAKKTDLDNYLQTKNQ